MKYSLPCNVPLKLITKPICILDIFIVATIIINSEQEQLSQEYQKLKDDVDYICDLKKNETRLLFIKNHLFTKNQQCSFIDDVKNFCKQQKIAVNSIEESPLDNENEVTAKLIEMNMSLRNDASFFKLIDHIFKYSPGFAKITNFYIERQSKINPCLPLIGASLTCKLYCHS
jgi:hypothetical protein